MGLLTGHRCMENALLPVYRDGDHVHEGGGHVTVKKERKNAAKKPSHFHIPHFFYLGNKKIKADITCGVLLHAV